MNGRRLGVGHEQIKVGTELTQGGQLIRSEVAEGEEMIQRWKHIQKGKGKERNH